MLTIALVCAASVFVLVFAGAYYFRMGLKKRALLFLWAVRSLIVAALLCAFFQPVFKIPTVAPDDRGAVVLLDVSKSMRLFNADSSVSRFLSSLSHFSPGRTPGPGVVQTVCFGDSTRPLPRGTRASFSDEHSYFPNQLGRDMLSRNRSLIIVSDGNFSNPSLPRGLLEDKTCYYVTLPSFSPRPFLRAEFLSAQRQAAQDSVFIARLLVQGYKKAGGPIDVTAASSGKRVARATCKAQAGYFSDTVSIRMPTSRPGRFLYTIVAADSADSLSMLLYCACDVVPRTLNTRICATRPTLDKRFISLALSKDAAWKLDTAGADVLFVLEWDGAAQEALSRLKPTGTVVFIGCAPGSGQVVVPDTFSLMSLQPDDSLARRLELRRMPPPTEILAGARSFPAPLHSILGCIARKAAPLDTLPFLASGVYGNHPALFCAARGLWAMEFLPLSMDRENETFSFMEYIVSIVKNQFLKNLNRAFFMYPASPEVTNLDTVPFCIIAPSEMVAAGPQSGVVHFILSNKNNIVLDTMFRLELNEALGNQTIRLRPLHAGTYAYMATLSSKGSRFTYADSLFVQDDDLEMSVHGQNALILNDLATPIEMNDSAGLRRALADDIGQESHGTIFRTIRITHSWGLLAVLFVLLGLEWLIRRKIGLDS
jgi:hypothetical protein